MHRRRLLASLSTGSLAGIAGCSDRGYEGSGTAGPPRLRVDGRWVTDPDGNTVVLRGVSVVDPVWGVEHADERGRDYWETLRLATDESAGWHARVLRIPVEPHSIGAVGLDAIVEEYLDRAVELAAERGVYVLLDYHANERYDTSSIDRRIRTFWDRVAPRYADESHVLYELFSEPTEPAAGGIEAWRSWRERASPWVSLVREHAPDTPIVVGSPAWSSMTAYAAEEPFEQEDLLYAAHVYPSWEPRTWEATFGTPALTVPVFVTEWGYANVDAGSADHVVATTAEWGRPFREWIDAHRNVHWCAATFDSRRRPAMFDTEWRLLGGDDHMGTLTRDWLFDRRADHRPSGSTPIPTGEGSPPAPPKPIYVVQVGETVATVQWDSVRNPDGDDVLQYRLTIDDREPAILWGGERSTVFRDLDPGREYEVRITAIDERGRESDSNYVRFRTHERGEPEATIPRTSSPPEIDGAVDEVWRSADVRTIDQHSWGDRFTGVADWRVLWDEAALYVLVTVADGEPRQDTPVEIYLDLDNSRESTYDGENDLQLFVARGATVAEPGTNSAPAHGSETTTIEVDGGWRAELAIPWADYGVRPIVGHRFGMDVHVVVEEDGERSGKTSWFDESDDAWVNPRTFATVELGE